MVDVSVIVCCYNSEKRIEQTLTYLSNQIFVDKIIFEVIIVDNNSNDHTAKIAIEKWKQLKSTTPIKIVFEPKPGLSFARKKGIEESKSDLLIFCDDDNWLYSNYIQNVYTIMNQNPKIGMLGGHGIEEVEQNKPDWFDKNKEFYAVGEQSKKNGDITFEKGYVNGAGAVIRKSILKKLYDLGFQHQLTDRTGNALTSGGDCELGYIIAILGYKIFYTDKLKFKHFIPQNRINKKYILKLLKTQLLTYYKLKAYQSFLLNDKIKFPKKRFYGTIKTVKKLIKAFYHYENNIESKLKISRIYYKHLYQLFYFNTFRKDIINVQNNIQTILDNNAKQI